MSNFIQVNVISHSKNALSSCYEHNVDRQKDGEDLPHLLSENDCLGNETITFSHIVVSCGTFEENLRNFYAQHAVFQIMFPAVSQLCFHFCKQVSRV